MCTSVCCCTCVPVCAVVHVYQCVLLYMCTSVCCCTCVPVCAVVHVYQCVLLYMCTSVCCCACVLICAVVHVYQCVLFDYMIPEVVSIYCLQFLPALPPSSDVGVFVPGGHTL